jgi:ureidoglycolate hydrolase
MIEIPARLVEVGAFVGAGYRPVLDFHGWRVAMLRFADVVNPATFHQVERHRETNEVFILTAGQADLIVCDGDDQPGEPIAVPMRQCVAYNVAQRVWHHVVMSPDAHVVLFERSDTAAANTDYAELPPEQVAATARQFGVHRHVP